MLLPLDPSGLPGNRCDDLKGAEAGGEERLKREDERASAGSFPTWFVGSVAASRARRSGAWRRGRRLHSSGGPGPGRPRSRKGRSSLGGGREAGNGVPLYGHRHPQSGRRAAVASRRVRWRRPARGCAFGSGRDSRGVFFGSGGFRVLWPFFPLASGAISSGKASFSTSRLLCGRRGCSTWHGGGLEDGERNAFHSPSEGKCGRGDLVSAGRLPLNPRWGRESSVFVFSLRRAFLREPRAKTRLPFFIQRSSGQERVAEGEGAETRNSGSPCGGGDSWRDPGAGRSYRPGGAALA